MMNANRNENLKVIMNANPEGLHRELSSEPEVHRRLLGLVREERRITVEVLRLLRKVEREMIYADLGYPSLFAYCTKALGYSESAAYRRIDSMRAIKDEPQIEEKIASGELSLSTVSTTRSTIRAHERALGSTLSRDLKSEIMIAVSNQSKRNAEKVTAAMIQSAQASMVGQSDICAQSIHLAQRPEPVSLQPSTERHLQSGLVRITMELTAEEMKVIEDLRQLKSKTQNTKELFVSLARKELHGLQRQLGDAPLLRQRKPRAFHAERRSTQRSSSRQLDTATRRTSWQRAGGQCEFVSPVTGQRCSARQMLEFDHRIPFAKGGSSALHNIRVLCRNHNVNAAVTEFGHAAIAQYVPSIR